MHRRALAIAALAAVSLTSGCAVNEIGLESDSNLSGTIVGGGASSQQSAQQVWIAGFQSAHTRVTVEYDPAGSGAGRDMFLAGGAHFAGSDRALHVEEIESSELRACAAGGGIVEIPVYISPIAIVFNLDGVDSLDLDADTLAGIFAGDITQWDDPAIAAHNPGVDLPSSRITAVHRSDDSGITENLTEYLAAAAPNVWSFSPSGVWPIEGGEAAQGNSGVVDSVSNGSGTIGYVEFSRIGDLGVVDVLVGEDYVTLTAEAAAAIIDASPIDERRASTDLAIEIDRTTETPGVYPIVLVSYLIGCERYDDPELAELVRTYFAYVISDEAQDVAADYAGSAPLSPALVSRAQQAISSIR